MMSEECPRCHRDCPAFRQGFSQGFCEPDQHVDVADPCFVAGVNRGREVIEQAADDAFQSQYSMNG